MRGRKTGGRRKGTPNKVTAEARAICAAILDDPTYRTNLTARARAGTLAPAVEAMLWHYAFGKPRESLEVTVGPAGDLSELSTEDLLHRVDGLREQLREQAGHEDLSTTQRYMHFSPKAVESAIRLLDGPVPAWVVES